MRTGAVLPARPPMAAGAAWSPNGLRDSKAGSAKQAPSPRRKWRRLKLANRSAAAFRSLVGLAFMRLRAARDWFGFMAGQFLRLWTRCPWGVFASFGKGQTL